MTTVLQINRVSKTFVSQSGVESPALMPVDLEIGAGEFVSFVGPSGCGKTTLLKICAGLISPTTGSVVFNGVEGAISPSKFGMAFQSPALLPWRTVLQNVLLPADVMAIRSAEVERRAASLLELMQLSDVGNKYPSELSGGMLQRAAIARAMIHNPEILLMDEPFGALDAMTREQLNEELQDLHMKQGKTVLFVTHGIQEAVFLSDRVIVLSGRPGELVADLSIPLARPRGSKERTSEVARRCEEEIRTALESIDSVKVIKNAG